MDNTFFTKKKLVTHCIIIARVTNKNQRVRVAKILNLLGLRSISLTVFGLPREEEVHPNDTIKWLNVVGTSCLKHGIAFLWACWILRLFFKLIFRKTDSSEFFICVGFESGLSMLAANLLGRKHSYMFDNADNISDSYQVGPFFKRVLRWLEKLIAQYAEIHLVPGYSRWSLPDKNLRVVANRPTQSLAMAAKCLASEKGYESKRLTGPLTIYLNGWLVDTRGVPTLLRALKYISVRGEAPVRVIVAGNIGCAAAEELVRLDNVEYMGLVDNQTALALYYQSHFAFTYYDPTIPINRLAEPNKWGDCLFTQTPFLTNEGIETVQWYKKNGLCITLPFDDETALVECLSSFQDNQMTRWKTLQSAFRLIQPEFWDNQMGQLFDEIGIVGNDKSGFTEAMENVGRI